MLNPGTPGTKLKVLEIISRFCAILSAQGWTNRTLAVHERVDSRFLVLPGSGCIFTEITEYKYFSPSKPSRKFKYKSELNTLPLDRIIEPILFL